MDDYKPRWVSLTLAVVFIFVAGTLGYYLLEDGWTLLDAFYMVVISITTVGYGETHMLSPQGRLFTIALLVFGLGTAATFAAQVARFMIEGELKGMFRRNKMQKTIRKLSNHYIVCGHGRTGAAICLKLYELDIPFVIVDSDDETLDHARQRGYLTVNGNAGSDITLISAGIQKAAGIVISCSDDGTSLLISLAARELNPDIYIIALGTFPTNEARMLRAGANTVVYPLRLGGEQIAHLIAKRFGAPTGQETISLKRQAMLGYELKQFRHFDASPTTVGEILTRYRAVQAVCLKPADGDMIHLPKADMPVNREDAVVILVRDISDDTDEAAAPSRDLSWSEEMAVGIDLMDGDHRGLFLLIKTFHDSLTRGRGKAETAMVFDKLLDYTTTHFKNEETLMITHQYPDKDNHIREHRKLTREVMTFYKDQQTLFPENIADFLYSWLVNHIMETDRQLGAYLADRGVN